MDQKLYDQVEPKAEFLIQALPYIRDFSDKIVVIEYGCRKYLSPIDEQTLDERYCTAQDGWHAAGCST